MARFFKILAVLFLFLIVILGTSGTYLYFRYQEYLTMPEVDEDYLSRRLAAYARDYESLAARDRDDTQALYDLLSRMRPLLEKYPLLPEDLCEKDALEPSISARPSDAEINPFLTELERIVEDGLVLRFERDVSWRQEHLDFMRAALPRMVTILALQDEIFCDNCMEFNLRPMEMAGRLIRGMYDCPVFVHIFAADAASDAYQRLIIHMLPTMDEPLLRYLTEEYYAGMPEPTQLLARGFSLQCAWSVEAMQKMIYKQARKRGLPIEGKNLGDNWFVRKEIVNLLDYQVPRVESYTQWASGQDVPLLPDQPDQEGPKGVFLRLFPVQYSQFMKNAVEVQALQTATRESVKMELARRVTASAGPFSVAIDPHREIVANQIHGCILPIAPSTPL